MTELLQLIGKEEKGEGEGGRGESINMRNIKITYILKW